MTERLENLAQGVFIEALCYAYFGGASAIAVALGVLLLGLPTSIVVGRELTINLVGQLVLLVAMAFVCGLPAGVLFPLCLRNRAYVPGDPLVDWLPWWPSGKWVLGIYCGGRYLPGWTRARVNIVWALFAVPTWLAAILAFQRSRQAIGW